MERMPRLIIILAIIIGLNTSVCGYTAPKVILLSGFEPFGGYPVNSSWEAIRKLGGQKIDDFLIKTVLLPVEYHGSAEKLLDEIKQDQPSIIVAFGMAAADFVRLESTAKNYIGMEKDNAGIAPVSREISANGAFEYHGTLPLVKIKELLISNQIKVSLSDDAGDYLCNYIYYRLMSQKDEPGVKYCGFVHLPPLDSVYTPDKLTGIVKLIIEAIIH